VAVNARTLYLIPAGWVISVVGSGALAYLVIVIATALR
jgi:phosphate/sulfate permease